MDLNCKFPTCIPNRPFIVYILYLYTKETLINSEFPQHKDVLPFSMTNKSLKMKKKGKSHFPFFAL